MDHLYLSVQDFLWTTCIILEEHLRKGKISISGSFRPLLRGSCKTTCARSLYEDPVRPLVQDLCFRILILLDHLSESCSSTSARSLSQDLCMRIILDHLYQDLVGPLVQDLCIRILLDKLYQDPVGPLVQDLCIRVLWTACVRTLYDHLCKISVSGSCWTTVSGSGWTTCARSVLGSLCEDPLDHLHQDPAGALVQDPCYEDTCARSLYQDPVGSPLSGSCRPVGPLLQDLCLRISVLGSAHDSCLASGP